MKIIDWQALRRAARQAARRAYCPYSNYPVGAALLATDGTVHAGCNVENASYGALVCTERVALFNAVSAGRRTFAALVIAAGDTEPAAPCGICRQVLSEFCASDLPVLCVTRKANRSAPARRFTLRDLLPHAFTLKTVSRK